MVSNGEINAKIPTIKVALVTTLPKRFPIIKATSFFKAAPIARVNSGNVVPSETTISDRTTVEIPKAGAS